MLEAPEAHFLATQIGRDLVGKKVETVVAGFSPHKFTFFNRSSQELEELLGGRIITGARALGGMVEILFGNTSLVFNDGANLRYAAAGEELPPTHQLLVGFTDQSCVTVTVRMYAGIICLIDGVAEGTFAAYYQTALTKPQVLSDNFTREYFLAMANEASVREKSAKAFLATEQRIPGLGNGVLQDILFNSGIHPRRKVAEIGEKGMDTLFDSIKNTLSHMLALGGRESERDLYGKPGGYVCILSKDTAAKPCPVCGTLIVKQNYMGGSVYYCPGCQPWE